MMDSEIVMLVTLLLLLFEAQVGLDKSCGRAGRRRISSIRLRKFRLAILHARIFNDPEAPCTRSSTANPLKMVAA
jgi:hypothetical protein